MNWGPTTAAHVGQHVLAQYIDSREGPLYIALCWGLLASWFGLLFAAKKNGFGETLRRSIYLLPALFAFIYLTWDLMGELTLCVSLGGSLMVVILLLMRPPTSRDPS